MHNDKGTHFLYMYIFMYVGQNISLGLEISTREIYVQCTSICQ